MTRDVIMDAYHSQPNFTEELFNGDLECSNVWDKKTWDLNNLAAPGFKITMLEDSSRIHSYSFVDGNEKFLPDFFANYLRDPTLQDWKCVRFVLRRKYMWSGGIVHFVWLRDDPAIAINVDMYSGSQWWNANYCRIRLEGSFKLLLEVNHVHDRAYIIENRFSETDSRLYENTVTRIVDGHKIRSLHRRWYTAIWASSEERDPGWQVRNYELS